MALHSCLLGLLMPLSLLIAQAAATTGGPQLALPNCPDNCGNLTIPYPFGVKENCYLNSSFFINCTRDESREPLIVPYWGKSGMVVSNISLEEAELQILQFVAKDCYNMQGNQTYNNNPWFSVPPCTISQARNKFFAVGCDAIAIFQGYRAFPNDQEGYLAGCMSLCDSLDNIEYQDSCSGFGCCQTNIPSGLQNLTVSLSSTYNHTKMVGDFNNCSYAFLVEETQFKFSNSSFRQLKSITELPAVLNWATGEDPDPCNTAQKRKDFACKANSKCVNPVGRSAGYICQCLPGYHGNPYLPDGCEDIDECMIPNPCSGTCVNSPGAYFCKCPRGYKNDGMNPKSCIKDNNRSKTILLIISFGIGAGIGLLLLLISAWLGYRFLKKRNNIKRKEMFFKRNGGLLLEHQLSSGEVNVEKIKLFRSKELEKSTDNFNNDRILGQGGQGTVYKGMLADGRIVAVKMSKIVDESQLSDFINEVVILSQINHRNVVQLLGCCLETEVPALVYEFIPNGTLSQYIHEQNDEFPLTWEIRLRIAMEIAGALSYLHASASSPIYHRDIKSTNILLDAKYRVKVADFGTSRSIAIDQTHLTTLVHGTFGYLDPEYFQSSQFTDKSDVYSFGVVLVELLTGQKPISFTRSQEEGKSLAMYFINSMQLDRLFEILDTQVVKGGSKADIIVVANLARRCLNLNGRKRPTMREVSAELEGVQMAEKTSNGEQKYEEVEYVRTDSIEPQEIVSSSMGTGPVLDGDSASLLHEIPLLSFKSL